MVATGTQPDRRSVYVVQQSVVANGNAELVASTNLQITPVPGAPFGAQIIGAELRSFGDGEYAAVRDALNKHTVVVFRDQQGLEPQD